jgi:hypothetical protein
MLVVDYGAPKAVGVQITAAINTGLRRMRVVFLTSLVPCRHLPSSQQIFQAHPGFPTQDARCLCGISKQYVNLGGTFKSLVSDYIAFIVEANMPKGKPTKSRTLALRPVATT